MQDEVGHAQLIYRVAEDLGKPREQMLADLISGKAKFHNVFHYPTSTWGDVGVIAWLVDAAAIISQKALLKCSYAPYARIMKKICWEESFHILHGRDVILAMMTGTDEQRALVQEALDRWWGPLMQFHGNPIPRDEDPMYVWRIKSQGNEEARQQFLEGYVPQIFELGLTVPDPELRRGDDGVWTYSEPDWDELRSVVTGHGPRSRERLAFRSRFLEQERWVRDSLLAAHDLGGVQAGEARAGVRARRLGRGAGRGVRRRVGARAVRPARRVGGALARAARRDPPHHEWADEFDLKYRRVDGYSIKARLKEARERAGTLLLGIADDELILGWRDSEWTGIAPTLEEDVAFSSIAQNEIGHARALYELAAAELGDDADALAFDARPTSTDARRSSSCSCSSGRHDRAALSVRGGGPRAHRRAHGDDDAELAGLAAKIDREEAYHRMHAEMWAARLRDEPRFRAAVDELWPYALGVLDAGAARRSSRAASGSTWSRRDERGEHTDELGELWNEMTEVRRSAPRVRNGDRGEVWAALDEIPDPEIPVVSLVDLGVIRESRSTAAACTWSSRRRSSAAPRSR